MKQCSKCKRFLPETEFRLRKKKGEKLHTWCKDCCKQYYEENKKELNKKQKEYNDRNEKKIKKWKREWYTENRTEIIEGQKKLHNKLRVDVLSHYSNGTMKCALCGCDDIDLLDLDHKYGDGCKRKERNFENSDQIFRWLIKNNYPSDYRVLCKNCNWKEGLIRRFPRKIYDEDKYGNIDSNFKRKVIALQIYSNGTMKCALCGCDDIDLLCIDHENGGGYAHRKKYKNPMVRWLRRNKYPKGFRVLCLNCNWKEGVK